MSTSRLRAYRCRNKIVRRHRLTLHPALFTIPLATAIALHIVPSDVTAPGALMVSTWTLTAGLAAAILLDIAERGMYRIFEAENVIMVALVVVIYPEALGSSYTTGLDFEGVRKVLLAIGTFATMVALGSSMKPLKLPYAVLDLARRHYSQQVLFRILLLCWGLAMFNFAYASHFSITAMLNGLLQGRFESPWARGNLGGWGAFTDFLSYFGYVIPTLTVLLALRGRSWTQPSVVTGMILSAILLAFIAQGGTRRLLVVIIGSAMLTWLCSKRRQLRLTHLAITAALLLALVVFLDMVLAARNIGLGQYSYNIQSFKGLRVDDNFQTLGDTLRVIPSEADYVGFNFLLYVFVRPVPRVFWPEKPTGPGFDLAQHLGARGVALAITFIGEQYMSFGWTGVIVGGIGLGFAARTWSQLLENENGSFSVALYGLGAMALFLAIRSLLELVLMTYPILCWYVLDRVFVKWARRRNVRGRPVGAVAGA